MNRTIQENGAANPTHRLLRCALLSSFTLDILPGMVSKKARNWGLDAKWHIGSYGQYAQEILLGTSALYTFEPQIIFLAVAVEDLMEGLPPRWSGLEEERIAYARKQINNWVELIRMAARRFPSSLLFIHNFLLLQPQPHPLLGHKKADSMETLTAYANSELYKLAAEVENVFPLDLAGVLSASGVEAASDARYYYLARMRLSRAAMESLAGYYVKILKAYTGPQKKCIALDLDNTLWGGIVGEDGPEHLVLGEDGLGSAFQEMQRVLLEYRSTGILLAICSKNDPELALSVIKDHPGMVLRPEHFASLRINWQDKATNLREIVAELNIGLDSLVFLDDSPFDREQVRYALPEVTVVDLPSDPSDYPHFAASLPYFDTLVITEEDQRRSKMYLEDQQRQELRQQVGSLEEFLRGLGVQVVVRRAALIDLPRLAQLTQKTNQFNLTTTRYTESDLLRMSQDPRWRLYAVEASDRVGESGIVGTAFVYLEPADLRGRLDTFLLSCRVLGREIERAFLSAVLSDLRNLREIEARYIPTKRNGVASEFLSRCGFREQGEIWTRSPDGSESICPDWIHLRVLQEAA